MRQLKNIARALGKSCRGTAAVEYGLVLALIVLVIIGGISALGGSMSSLWSNVSTRVSDAH